jgi:hypothetical protein
VEEVRHEYRYLDGKPEEKRYLRKPMLRFKYNIKTKCESTKYTELTISMKVNPS